jgi:hypothetical protein
MTDSEEIVAKTLFYCADCLADFKDGEQIIECNGCEGLLHENCSRCICERIKSEREEQ